MYRYRYAMSIGEAERSRCHTAWMGPVPRNASKRSIMEFFREYNPVECKIIDKGGTNRFSFILFNNEVDRDNAINAKCNCEFLGEKVVVNRSFNAYEGLRLGGRERYDEWTGEIIHY